MNLSEPRELLFDQLRDLYSAKSQVILTLPELAGYTSLPELRALLLEHESESIRHKEIITAIFERHGEPPDGEISEGIRGLIVTGNARLARAENPQIRDLLLVAHCNRLEHYEIAAHGFTVSLARHVGFVKDAHDLAGMLGEDQEMAHHLAQVGAAVFGEHIPPVDQN
jgi:ferritin-like metal-binding protein YciE